MGIFKDKCSKSHQEARTLTVERLGWSLLEKLAIYTLYKISLAIYTLRIIGFFFPKGIEPIRVFLIMCQMQLILKILMMIINKKFLIDIYYLKNWKNLDNKILVMNIQEKRILNFTMTNIVSISHCELLKKKKKQWWD